MDNKLDKLDKSDEKYKLALKFKNNILVNAQKSEINDILEFKDINRQQIVTQQNLDMLNNIESEIYKLFDKVKCGFYRKSDNYVINCLRGMIKQIGYKIILEQKDKTVNINGESYRKKYMIYHIE